MSNQKGNLVVVLSCQVDPLDDWPQWPERLRDYFSSLADRKELAENVRLEQSISLTEYHFTHQVIFYYLPLARSLTPSVHLT